MKASIGGNVNLSIEKARANMQQAPPREGFGVLSRIGILIAIDIQPTLEK